MIDRLRALRRRLSFTPKLARRDGYNVMMIGEEPVFFPEPGDAEFFVFVADNAENLALEADALADARALEAKVVALEKRAAQLEAERDAARAEVTRLERAVTEAVGARSNAEARARTLARAIRKVPDLVRQIQTLAAELQAERNKSS